MLPPAPPRLSTTTDLPSAVLSRSETQRARMSDTLPAADVTISRIGLAGYVWANAHVVNERPSPIASAAFDDGRFMGVTYCSRTRPWMERHQASASTCRLPPGCARRPPA